MKRRRMKRIIFISYLFFYIIQSCFCFAKKEGTTGGFALKQEIGARQMGMGGAYIAIADDVNTLYYNPAGLANIIQAEMSTMYLDGLLDATYGFVGYAQPLKTVSDSEIKNGKTENNYGAVGIGIVSLQGGEIEINYLDGTSEKRKAQEDYVLTLGYGKEIKKNLQVGLNLKTIYATLVEEYKAYAFALDMGAIYNLPYPGLNAGIVLQNLGTEMKYENEGDPLPLTVRIGAAYKKRFNQMHCIQGAIDLIKSVDSQIRENVGMEYMFKDVLTGRMGTRLGYDLGLITCGIGVCVDKVKLDYAWVGGKDWDNQHWVSLSFYFSQDLVKKRKKKEEEMLMEEIRRGMKFFKDKQWQEAIRIFKEVLKKKPKHKIARKYLKETEEKLNQLVKKLFNKGKQCYKKNRWLEAVQNWEEALKLSDEKKYRIENEIKKTMAELKILFDLGSEFYNKGKYGEALKKWQELADKYPGYLNMTERIEDVQIKIKEMSERKQVEIIDGIIIEGIEYYEKNKYLDAVEKWRQVLRLNPRKKTAIICMDKLIEKYFTDGQMLYKKGEFKKAFVQWEKISEVELEYCKENKERIKKAKKEFKERIEISYKKGVEEYIKGNYLGALIWWRKALCWMPGHKKMQDFFIKANLAQGILFYRDNRLEEAIKHWEEILELDSKHKNVLMYIRRAKTKQERLLDLK